MNTREWALVAFTLLMQASVGVVVLVTVMQPGLARTSANQVPRLIDTLLVIAAVTGVLALTASLLHLGQPLEAWLAITNVRSSWLSREIVIAVIYVASVLLLVGVAITRPGTALARWGVLAPAVLGFFCILAMSMLYMTPAQPVWNRLATPASFIAATLLLGIAIWIATLGIFRLPSNSSITVLAMCAVIVVVAQLLMLVAHLLAIPGETAGAVVTASNSALIVLAGVRAAAAICTAALLVPSLMVMPRPLPNGVLLVVFVFISELAGRLLFYSSSVRFGLR